MLKIRSTVDGAATVLIVSGRLDAGNVSELSALLDAIPVGTTVVLDLADLVLADRETRDGVTLRSCPAYIRVWMASKDIP